MLYTDVEIKKRKRKEKAFKNLSTTIMYIIVIPLLIYNVTLIIQSVLNPSKTPSFLGIKTYVIISGSMEPELNIGDIVIVKTVKEDILKKQDIICFRQGESVITHRIADIIQTSDGIEFKTKGDNNNTEDTGTTTFESIEGKVINKIPKLGKIVLILQKKSFIILIIIFFYIYLIYINKVKNKKNERRVKRLRYEREKEVK